MAVLPWGHSRNQTSSGTDKPKSLDWFSRTSTEPSRNAVSQLMKQHSRGGSGASVNFRIRSRPSTPSPQPRSATPIDIRAGSSRGVSLENSSAPSSRPGTPIRSSTFELERSDSVSKSLFQKGGLLRRKGSKMSMSFNTNPVAGLASPIRPESSRAGLRGRETPTSPIRDDERRPSISRPFDFTHIMHGDPNAFTGLGRIDESDLALQFDAIQERYRTNTEMGEPRPKEPEALTPTRVVNTHQKNISHRQSPVVRPSTPPPAPPPKDVPPTTLASPADIRASRSTENFSRPTPRSPTTSSDIRPSSCHLTSLAPSPLIVETAVKPLPQPPSVVHAVSTQDDTARLLIAAPLPTPPMNNEKSIPRHQRQSSSKSSLRHMSTFPSARHPQINTVVQDGQLLGIREEDGLARPHSDYELSQRAYREASKVDQTLTQAAVPVEDWEEAIDSAWEMEDDRDVYAASAKSKIRETYLTIDQPSQEAASSPSTPLMTMGSGTTPKSLAGAETNTNGTEPSPNVQHGNKHASGLVGLGLGIETEGNNVFPSRASRLPTLEVVTTNSNRASVSPRLTRSAYSAISHSSSQESIILSIASSIISTQRSSISSVSVSDYAHSSKADRTSMLESASSPLLNVTTQKAARPESGCLPPTLLQQMNSDVKKNARPDSGCLPASIASKRSSAVSKPKLPETPTLPQDVLSTFPVPEAIPRRRSSAIPKPPKSDVDRDEDRLSALPTDNVHIRTHSGSRNSASCRMSTHSNPEGSSASRRRSSTQGSRTRASRVSYSLFPSAGPSASISSHGDTDSVTS